MCLEYIKEHPARPDIFESTMFVVVDDFSSPCRGIGGDSQLISIINPIQWGAKLFRFPRVKLQSMLFTVAEIVSGEIENLTLCTEYPAPSDLTYHF